MGDKKTYDQGRMALGRFSSGTNAKPKTTIVGGQPDKRPESQEQLIPIGLEQVLLTAATSPVFRAELLDKRLKAVETQGFCLTKTECSILNVTPTPQLETMIARLDVSPNNIQRRDFLRSVASTIGMAAVGYSFAACDDRKDRTMGIRSDMPKASKEQLETVPAETTQRVADPKNIEQPTDDDSIDESPKNQKEPTRYPMGTGEGTVSLGIRPEREPVQTKQRPKSTKIKYKPEPGIKRISRGIRSRD